MDSSLWALQFLMNTSMFCRVLMVGLSSSTPAIQNFRNKMPSLGPYENKHFFRIPFTRPSGTTTIVESINRGSPPFVLIQPMAMSQGLRTNGRLVFTLPKGNINILNAEAVSEKGQQFLPTTLKLSLKDINSDDFSKANRYITARDYSSQISSFPQQASRYHYDLFPMSQGHSEEDDNKAGRWNKGEVSYEMDDLMGSSGGRVTIIKAQKARQPKVLTSKTVMSEGSSYKPMKAIIIEPKEIEAMRVHMVEANTEKVIATKARVIASSENPLQGYKAKVDHVSYKRGISVKTKDEDWAASNLHYMKAKAPQDSSTKHQDESFPPMELHCGGAHGLGWCDLGMNYPMVEVSQITEMCKELVSHMFVEIPEKSEPMEDSLSRNITNQTFKPNWSTNYKKPLCEVNRDVIRPSFAQDTKGKWHVIIQTDAFPQRIALEVCKNLGEPCSSNDICSKSKSQCLQKYSHHQLISFDPESAETCPYIGLYKFPTTCVCLLA